MIKFSCPKCSRGITASDEKAGEMFSCPACRHRQQVPMPFSDVPSSKQDSVPSTERKWHEKIHPEVWLYGKQALAHFIALLMFSIVMKFYFDYRVHHLTKSFQQEIGNLSQPNFGAEFQKQMEESQRLLKQMGQ